MTQAAVFTLTTDYNIIRQIIILTVSLYCYVFEALLFSW